MQVIVTFDEIKEYIIKNFQKDISLQYINDKSVSISMQLQSSNALTRMLNRILNTVANLDISIKEITNNNINLSYNGNGIIKSFIIELLLNTFKTKAKDIYDDVNNNELIVYLQKIEQLENFFNYCSLKDISFLQDKIQIDIVIK